MNDNDFEATLFRLLGNERVIANLSLLRDENTIMPRSNGPKVSPALATPPRPARPVDPDSLPDRTGIDMPRIISELDRMQSSQTVQMHRLVDCWREKQDELCKLREVKDQWNRAVILLKALNHSIHRVSNRRTEEACDAICSVALSTEVAQLLVKFRHTVDRRLRELNKTHEELETQLQLANSRNEVLSSKLAESSREQGRILQRQHILEKENHVLQCMKEHDQAEMKHLRQQLASSLAANKDTTDNFANELQRSISIPVTANAPPVVSPVSQSISLSLPGNPAGF